LYETVLGTEHATLIALGRVALAAMAVVTALVVVSYPLSYRRVMRGAVEQPDSGGRGRTTAPARWLTAALARDGASRASMQFFLATAARLEVHRFTVAIAAGAALAWMLPTLIRWDVFGASDTPSTAVLALPLSTMTFLLAGLRVAAAVPSNLRAAWVFDAAPARRRRLQAGLRRAMLAVGVAPPVLAAAPVYWQVWGAGIALQHSLFCLAAGALITEILLRDVDGMPCASPWRPEHANLRAWWPAYLTAFIVVAGAGSYSFAASARASLGRPVLFVILLGTLMALAAAVRWSASRRPEPLGPEEEDSGVVQLGLS
jgi:hypothetical protein